MDLDLEWNDLENNTFNKLKFACQQLQIHPPGLKKSDLVHALKKYRNNHPELLGRQYKRSNEPFISPRLMDEHNEFIANRPQNPYTQPQAPYVQSQPQYTIPQNPYTQPQTPYVQIQVPYPQNQTPYSRPPYLPQQNEFQQSYPQRGSYSCQNEKKILHENIKKPPNSEKPRHNYTDHSIKEASYSDYSPYTYQSSANSSERMSPVAPAKYHKTSKNKIIKKASTGRKVRSIITSIILIILILFVLVFSF